MKLWGIVFLIFICGVGFADDSLAPFPLYFTPLGKPKVIRIEVEGYDDEIARGRRILKKIQEG